MNGALIDIDNYTTSDAQFGESTILRQITNRSVEEMIKSATINKKKATQAETEDPNKILV